MADILIHKPDGMTDHEALLYVQAVIKEGRVSDNGKSYCAANIFSNGVIVRARKKKMDIFNITERGPRNGET